MGAKYSFYVKTIETQARAFFKVIIFSIGSVKTLLFYFQFYTLKLNNLGLQCLKISIGFYKTNAFCKTSFNQF